MRAAAASHSWRAQLPQREGRAIVASREFTPEEAVARLERRGGVIAVQARVREGGASFPTGEPPTYRCAGREDGATLITGPRKTRWLLRTDADRASLAANMMKVRDAQSARLGGPGLVFVLGHRDELQADGGYAQFGCLFALVSTVVGLVIGIAVAWLVTGDVDGGYALIAPVAGFLVAMFTGDAVGSALTSAPALRDHVVDLAYLYMTVMPGLLTFLIIVVGSAVA